MEDTSIMPWGRHQGKKMANVPPDYLLWIYENDKCSGGIKDYIIKNMDVIKAEIALQQKRNR